MKKLVTFLFVVLFMLSVGFAGDVRISAKSSTATTTTTTTTSETDSSWWDDVCEWVESLF